MRRAVLSVSDKRGVVDLARGLVERGFEIVSTGGTARTLATAEVAVRSVSEITRFPELLDGRVKTLHPAVHAGILARRDHPDDLAALDNLGLATIDIVAVNLYPFAQAARRSELPVDAVLDKIDIGGPTLIRAAAKNFRDVLVVVDPADYAAVLEALDRVEGPRLDFRLDLARKAFAHTAEYDSTIADVLDLVQVRDLEGSGLVQDLFRQPWRRDDPSPARLRVSLRRIRTLRYGENPDQPAAWYANGPEGFGAPIILQGKELSFNNLLDLDAAARLLLEFDEPAAAVIKHMNPCGVATGASIADAYVRARDADSLSAFGGIVGVNRPIDRALATALTSTFIEAIVAPSVTDDAKDLLSAKPNLRVLEADFSTWREGSVASRDLRSILGGILVQSRDTVSEARAPWPPGDIDAVPYEVGPASLPAGFRVVTRRAPSPEEWTALRFAWRVCAHVKSNAVVFSAVDRTLAVGAGQMSRVDAVKVAILKAGGSVAGSVAASEAFFPFRDGVDVVAAAGATAIVQPGGAKRDPEVIAAADEHGLAMVFTGRRHFRH